MERVIRVIRTTTLAVALAATALSTTACGDRKKSASPYESKIANAIPKLEAATGLKFKTPPKFEARTKDEVRSFLEKSFANEVPAEELKGSERVYKRLGLLPDTLDLTKYMLALLSEQVVGYYDPKTKVLYIVQGASDEMVSVTVSHELVHALQDQYIDLDSLQKARGNNDRQSAAQAVIEGEATYEQLSSMLGNGALLNSLPGGWDRVRQMIRENNATMPVFSQAPTLIQETLLFPYLSGAEFMRTFKEKFPGKAPFGNMPVSSEQVLHEDRFFTARDDPTTITLPPLKAGKAVYENNFGEFETRLFLFQHLKDRDAAYRGAAGWDGDRYVLFDLPRGEGLAWASVWDTSVDAAEFFDLLDTSIIKRFGNVKPTQASQSQRSYTAGGRTLSVSITDVSGRAVVLYVDVPAGASTDVFDMRLAKLEE